MYTLNDKKSSKKKILKYAKNPKNVIQEISVELLNKKKNPKKAPTMEGFSIPSEYLIDLAEKSIEVDASVTATFTNCGKLGGKTVIIIVK